MTPATRTTLRRMICAELQMPFYRRFPNGNVPTSVPSDSPYDWICDTKLKQAQDYWNGQWFYNVTKNEQYPIIDFDGSNGKIKMETTFITNPAITDTYEILSIWNASEIHSAINRAIADAYPSFFDVVTDETLILKEDTMAYSLASLTYLPWIVTKVWIEAPQSALQGTATAGAVGSITDSKADFSSVNSNYKVSIYSGTGAGQLRSVSSVTGTTQINVSSNWTTTPDSTSKYAVWDPTDQVLDWRRLQEVRFNSKESPTLLYLTANYNQYAGFRIRLEYISVPTTLSTEASTTSVPQEFILHKTLHFLYSQKVNDNRADRQRYMDLQTYHFNQAEIYRSAHAYNMPEATLWTPAISPSSRGIGVDGDPLGW